MGFDTSYGFSALQTGASDGGIFFGGIVLLPIAFAGLVLAMALGSMAIKSIVEDFNPGWAITVAMVSTFVISTIVRGLLSVPPLEVELVAVSATLLFPLGIAVKRREQLWIGSISVTLVVALYSMLRVFPNTFGEVVPLTLGAGLVFFLVGYLLDR